MPEGALDIAVCTLGEGLYDAGTGTVVGSVFRRPRFWGAS